MTRPGGELFTHTNGEAVLRTSFVTYLDELGTSARLSTLTNADLRDDLKAYELREAFLHDPSWGDDHTSQRVLYFSDNLVVVRPIDEPYAFDKPDAHPLPDLYTSILAAGTYQLNLALHGRFLRGGLARGLAYADNQFVTGPAHLCAVQLEEKRAIFPRVLLDDACAELVRSARQDDGPAQTPFDTSVLFDQQGCAFINYLNYAVEECDADQAATSLARHREHVRAGLHTSGDSQGIHAKYKWVAKYHNFVCREQAGRDDLAIPEVDHPVFRFRG